METMDFDKTNPQSIERYARHLIGHSFRDILKREIALGYSYAGQSLDYYESKAAKGSLGHMLEEHYFHYSINSDADPDFIEAGVELKATPYEVRKNGKKTAKERLVITMINYMTVVDEPFELSHLYRKAKLILLIYYHYLKGQQKLDYSIDYVHLFQIPEEDKAVIEEDYNTIVDKIKAGKAHELSEGDTLYLGACTKGTSASSVREQPFSPIKAKQRAFCLKQSYMTFALNNYVIPSSTQYERIMKNRTQNFQKYVVKQINQYAGWSVKELRTRFDYNARSKSTFPILVYRILGVKSNQAEEFVKAGIRIKTIRLMSNGKSRECMSFPTMNFREVASEDWEDDKFANYLKETKFLVVVFQDRKRPKDRLMNLKEYDYDMDCYLNGCQFWNMPLEDIETHVKDVWQKTKNVLNHGIVLDERGRNNFPKLKDDLVCHVRPHGRDHLDTDILPDGSRYPKQSFWLRNSYIVSKLRKDLIH